MKDQLPANPGFLAPTGPAETLSATSPSTSERITPSPAHVSTKPGSAAAAISTPTDETSAPKPEKGREGGRAAVHSMPPGVSGGAAPSAKGDEAPDEAFYGPPPQTFADMKLLPDLEKAITEMGFREPTPVQCRTYRPFMAGRDLIVQARTGSGKTAAFGIPLAQGLIDPKKDCKNGQIQALVLGPTRELALQVATEVSRIASGRQLTVTAVYGGAPMGKQTDALKAGSHLVAGTPGRVLDHLRRGTLSLANVKALILDEADEMLSMGFLEDIIEVIKQCPPTRQTLLFSATMPDEILRLVNRFLRTPLNLQLSEGSVSSTDISHAYYMIPGTGRMRDLLRVLKLERPDSAVIFCNTREETNEVAEFMRSNGLDAEAISSDLTQAERERVMGRMKTKTLHYLVATDVAARGIDISDLSHVINYTFPESAEVYIHRTGRTGRAGKRGVAISLVSPRELGNFYYVKLSYKIKPEERTLPTEAELQTLREAELLDRLLKELADKKPPAEMRSLLKRVMASEEGERLLAILLEQHLHGKPVGASPSGQAHPGDVRAKREPSEAPRRSEERPPERRELRDARPPREGREAGGPVRDSRDARPARDSRFPRETRDDRPRPPISAPREQVKDGPVNPTPVLAPFPQVAPAPVAPAAPVVPAVSAVAAPPPPPAPAPVVRLPAPPIPAAPVVPARPAVPVSEGLISAEDGREFWEAWVDARTASPGVPAPSAQSPVPATRLPRREEASDRRPRPERADRLERPERTAVSAGMVRLYLNLGRREQVSEDQLQGFFAERGLPRLNLEIHGSHTYLFVPDAQADQVVNALHGAAHGGRAVICERARR